MSVNDLLLYEIAMRPHKPSKLDALESCALLRPLDPTSKKRLAEASFLAYAERGELIWTEGDKADFAGVVGVGFVKMTKESVSGQEVAVELLGPGEVFGLLAVLEGHVYPLSASAVSNTWYLKIPGNTLQSLFKRDDGLLDSLVRQLAPRLRQAHSMMTRFSSNRPEERLAAVLLILAESFGEPHAGGLRIRTALSGQDLAEMAGTGLDATLSILGNWQRKKLLQFSRHHVTIGNLEGLQAEFKS